MQGLVVLTVTKVAQRSALGPGVRLRERAERYNLQGARIDVSAATDEVNAAETATLWDPHVGPANLCVPLGGTGQFQDAWALDEDWVPPDTLMFENQEAHHTEQRRRCERCGGLPALAAT